MAVGYPVIAIVAPAGILCAGGRAVKAQLLHLICHIGAVPVELSLDDGVYILPYGVLIGCDLNSCAIAAHMVMILIGLGHPLVEEYPSHISRFNDILREGVAVVVVAGIDMIKAGIVAALIRRALCLIIPVGDHDLAIGVEAGDHYEHDIIEYVMYLVGVLRNQVIGQIYRHLRAADLGGVKAHALDRNGLALFDKGVDLFFGKTPGIGQLHAGAADLFEIGMVLR